MTKKKVFKIILAGVLVFILGGIGGFVFDKHFFPFLGSCKIFSDHNFFQMDRDDTTIIKETEKIIIKDDNSINDLSSSAKYSVVDIIAKKEKAKSVLIKESQETEKSGVGTVLTNDGVIVTHKENVFDEDAKYSIIGFDGSIFEARLMGIDNFSELAFLRVEGVNLTNIPFANPDDMTVGKKLIMLGGSSGNGEVAVTEGILSDYDETFNLAGTKIASSEKLEGVFRLDSGNHENYIGGPVINYSGELVAITSSVKSDNKREYFQIPSNKVRSSMYKVFSGSEENTVKLGIYYVSIDSTYAHLKDLPLEQGAMVYSASGNQGLAVIANSAAAKAGIKIDDIITSVDGEEINLDNSLSSYINKYKTGDRIELGIIRKGKDIAIEVTL